MKACPLFTKSLASLLLFVAPIGSTNYSLEEYGFGGGGTDRSQSSNYQLHGIIDQTAENQLEGDNYNLGPGLAYVEMAHVPPAPLLTNEADWYNKLKLVIDAGSNPSDATFAVAISTDNFVTTHYVQSDFTVGPTLGSEDWQSYLDWGGNNGVLIVGLQADTTYSVKVKSEQGDFTEGPWGPITSTATSPPHISFDIDVSATDEETNPPHVIDFGEVDAEIVTTSAEHLWLDLSTNAEAGGSVYVKGAQAGLASTTTGYTIPSSSANLALANQGFGLQVTTVNQASGGPLSASPPYNGSNDVVGEISTQYQTLLSAIGSPIVDGRASTVLKLIITSTTPAANDYAETLTLIATAMF